MKRTHHVLAVLLAAFLFAGCSSEKQPAEPAEPADSVPDAPAAVEEATPAEEPEEPAEPAAPATAASAPDADAVVTPEQLKAALKEKNPNFTGEALTRLGAQGIDAVGINDPAIEDISPLKGLPLVIVDLHDSHVTSIDALAGMTIQQIDLSNTGVSDVSVLSEMPLVNAYFNGCPIKAAPKLTGAPADCFDFTDTPLEDLSGLAGATVTNLYLVHTKVKDLAPLKNARIQSIWLNDAPVEDCSPLAFLPAVSVTLEGTKVSDISCFKSHPTLQRLHIGETEVTDLTPVQWMPGLTRLIFTPNRIKTGIEYARRLPDLREIGTAFGTPQDEGKMWSPDQFWAKYDAGEFD